MVLPAVLIALSIQMILTALAVIYPASRRVLPLGGSSIAQAGALVVLAVGLAQLYEVLQTFS